MFSIFVYNFSFITQITPRLTQKLGVFVLPNHKADDTNICVNMLF